MWYNSILETIGNTPMIAFNKITQAIPGTILAKIDTFNPGNSIKDRMALQMVEDAEAEGKINPGGTLIESTSGNTGMGLALVCIAKGYKLICTMSDKQSKEKMDILRAVGAEVIVCPTDVEPEDQRSYYSVARRLEQEIPNSYYVNQYDNLSNRKAHYLTTGPEIWEQTEGKITHLVVGVGTGGTISGVGKYLREKNPNVTIWGIDTYGSVFKKYHETGIFDKNEIYPYITEGIGEDILPKNVDFSLIDHFEKVGDKEAAIMTRRLAREEGFFVGNSCGAAVQGLLQLKDRLKPEDVVVVIFHDSGTRYIGKIFNDDWMRERGFLDNGKLIAADIVNKNAASEVIFVTQQTSVKEAVGLMTQHNISQLPVMENGKCVGTVHERDVFQFMIQYQDKHQDAITCILKPALPEVALRTSLEEMSALIDHQNPALLVRKNDGKYAIITRHDIIKSLGK